MQDIELYMALAEIAGVFVGFGALIAIRSAGAGDAIEVAHVGMVVSGGVVVIASALAPVVVSRYGVSGHELWLACSLLLVALFWVPDLVIERLSPERRAMMAAYPLRARVRVEIVAAFLWVPMHLLLITILLGLIPDHEPALYLSAVVLNLLQVAYVLLLLVFGVARLQAARGE